MYLEPACSLQKPEIIITQWRVLLKMLGKVFSVCAGCFWRKLWAGMFSILFNKKNDKVYIYVLNLKETNLYKPVNQNLSHAWVDISLHKLHIISQWSLLKLQEKDRLHSSLYMKFLYMEIIYKKLSVERCKPLQHVCCRIYQQHKNCNTGDLRHWNQYLQLEEHPWHQIRLLLHNPVNDTNLA